MRLSLLLTAAISIASLDFALLKSVRATTFKEQEVNQNQFAVIAAPYRHGYNLVVVEQISGQQKCWLETGSYPTKIEPLFLNFDFTDACKRSSDSNSYSIRFNGQDYGMDYLLNIVEQNGELHLVGVPRDSTKPQLHIGRTYGLSSGSLKIILNPQWHLTRRTHEENATEHIYLSNSSRQFSQGTQLSATYLQPNKVAAQPIDSYSQHPRPQNYPQPVPQPMSNVYQQPVYPVQAAPQPMGNVYQQPVYSVQPVPQPMGNVYQQPVYPVQPAPQPMGNIYQPVYPVQPINNGYRQQ